MVSIDFFVVPIASFKLIFVFVVLEHNRRKILHFNVTKSPSAFWTGQQIVETFPYDTAPKYLIRDNDSIYGKEFRGRVDSLDIKQVPIAYRSPWQNGYCERVIGSIRLECCDHVIVFNEAHLRRVLREYFNNYYNTARTHLSLDKDCPEPRMIEMPDKGEVTKSPVLGGLHHRYFRNAA
ncbi:transposase [bacterium]|nr:transposase [bacterium]